LGSNNHNKISWFADSVVEEIGLPERFTFPFYYNPHPLTILAAEELQHYLETQTDLEHNFEVSEDADEMAIGKMFGVLIVTDAAGRVGYLSAFSGKLAGTNDHSRFVPPVFDMLTEAGFFIKEKEIIDAINKQMDNVLANENYKRHKQAFEQLSLQAEIEIAALKKQLKDNKNNRKIQRDEQKKIVSKDAYTLFEAEMIKQSQYDKRLLKVLIDNWKETLDGIEAMLQPFDARIEALKEERKERSISLQRQLFEQYLFLNKDGKSRSLLSIFKDTAFGKPPSAAGECATPKLLQYAFANRYKPLAMAEFWWGASPKSEIRKHKQFYPACTGKCKPILAHMLEGMPMDDNPFIQSARESLQLKIIYEDDSLLVVNKPSGLLSVPGIDIKDSVYTRLKATLVDIEPLIIHRLDMGTSGLLVVAKTRKAQKQIQRQFLNRTISKRYTALLSKAIDGIEGEIRLPLIADIHNRPLQKVCYKTGKKSITKWKVVEVVGDTTRIHFLPQTGRTHQLRVHSAHPDGLNVPIVGDDLYGTPADRLYLHAAHLEFVHPETKQRMSFDVPEDF